MDPCSSPSIIPSHNPYDPFPHSLLSTREKNMLPRLGHSEGSPGLRSPGCSGTGQITLEVRFRL